MAFIPISIDDYVKLHLMNNPAVKEKDLRDRLNEALAAYQKKVKCSCGNDIWVIGSAEAGNSCFTCITGEGFPEDDFEIDLAIKKGGSRAGRRHINDIPPERIAGFFSDDGYEINLDLIKKPSLCITCALDGDPNEELLCQMNRHDQEGGTEFKCFAYKKKEI